MDKLIVSQSPHDENYTKTTNIMLNVIIALLPAWCAAIYFFGLRVIPLTAVCIGSSIFFEYASRRIMKRDNTVGDMSAALTGLILAMNLPVTLPYWMAVIGAFVAIVIVKQLFGGLGQNFANPAITARIVLMVSFTSEMTRWIKPLDYDYDAVSSATPLVLAKNGDDLPSYLDLFLGKTGGCLGEVCALALIIGGLFLICTKVITWHIPVSIIVTVALFAACTGLVGALPAGMDTCHYVAYELLTGGLMLGAFFMATDYVTSPMSAWGKIIFGIGIGFIMMVIRTWGAYPEGMSFAILIMNACVPLLNKIRPQRFGEKKK